MLEVRSISKSFGGLAAVSEATLTVPQGKIISLIGPNGAGKTTLFALISGFLKPDQGSVTFNGLGITNQRPHRICQQGLVRTFQVVKPFANLTVRENIAVAAHTRIAKRALALDKAAEVAARVGLEGALEQSAGALTIAGRKRLELARALATEPKLLLLDEVMAGLNATEIHEIVDIIRSIRDAGVTIFLIEHVMQAVMSLSDYTYVLNHGAMIADGEPRAVTSSPQVIEAYLGHGAAERIAAMAGKFDA
jgi:branched-chain amino acid transport system ATP-binding protein